MAWLALPARDLSRAKMRAADNTKTLSMADRAALPSTAAFSAVYSAGRGTKSVGKIAWHVDGAAPGSSFGA